MKLKKKRVVIFLYNRLFDPLIQGNFWLYIEDYLNDPESLLRFHVVSYEDRNFPLTTENLVQLDKWKAQGLQWTPLTWHRGTFLVDKFKDLATGFLLLFKLRCVGYRNIVTLGSVAGSFGYIFAFILYMRLFLYQYEPHSEVSRDSGAWDEDDFNYKLVRFFERKSAEYAHVIASGTRFMGERLKNEWCVKGRFFRIPTVVNENKFYFSEIARKSVRRELGISEDQPVLFYTGKFGGLYYAEEIAMAFSWLLEYEPKLHFLIVTPNDNDYVHSLFKKACINKNKYSICHSSYEDIDRFYSAGDLGLITIPPGPGQKFRSSIKVGEYLCSGMPFLTATGVSEDYIFATQRDVGVVVEDFSEKSIRMAWHEIIRFLNMDPDLRRNRCRSFGIEYRGFSSLNPIFKSAINALIKETNKNV